MMTREVLVPVQSSTTSAITITQVVGIVCSMVAAFTANKYSVPPEQQAMLVVAITAIQGLVTWVLHTYFTAAIAPQAVTRLKLRTVLTPEKKVPYGGES